MNCHFCKQVLDAPAPRPLFAEHRITWRADCNKCAKINPQVVGSLNHLQNDTLVMAKLYLNLKNKAADYCWELNFDTNKTTLIHFVDYKQKVVHVFDGIMEIDINTIVQRTKTILVFS